MSDADPVGAAGGGAIGDAFAGDGGSLSSPVLLRSPKLHLDPVTPAKYHALLHLELELSARGGWRLGASTPNMQDYVGLLWRDVHDQRVVRVADQADGPPLGLVTSYECDLLNGTAWIRVMVAPSLQLRGYAFEALGIFIEHLFSNWPLRQLYAEAHAFNYTAYRSGEGRAFEEIACYRDHVRWQGSLHDSYVLMITRDRWEATYAPRVRRRQEMVVDL